jgi:uncharacterized membrane protein YdjX (TVP38/TMEM64 family)
MPEPDPTPQTESFWAIVKRLGPAAVLGVIAAVMPLLGSIALYTAMATTNFGPWLKSHGTQGLVLYTIAFIFLTGLALLPTYAQSALGGYAFGIARGAPAAILGFAGGAIIGYEIALRASGDRVMRLVDEHPKWRAVRDALVGRQVGGGMVEVTPGFWKTLGLVTLLRLPPNSPFAITNLVMASVKVPRVPFLLGTIFGMAPRTTLAVVLGASLNEFTHDSVNNAVPRWVWYAGIAIAIGIVLFIGHKANQAISRLSAGSASVAK